MRRRSLPHGKVQAALCLAALLLASGPGHATTFVLATDAELMAGADAVVIAHIEAVSGLAPDDEHLETLAEASVVEVIKGYVPERIILREPGGTGPHRRRV